MNRHAASQLIVTITSGGAIFAGPDEVSVDELPARLALMKGQGKEENLVIRADKSVAVDLVIKVIDAAKATGIDKFTIQTEKEKL